MIRRKKTPLTAMPGTESTVALLHSGREYFDTLHFLLAQAREEIHVQVYILADDSTGRPVMQDLMDAAMRGVRVFVLADGYASAPLSKTAAEKLRLSGVQFRFFEPFFKSQKFYLGRRLHRKVVTIDGSAALVGGINISDHYNDTSQGNAWKDYALLLRGPVATILQRLCRRSWRRRHRFRAESVSAISLPDTLATALPNQSVRIRQNDWLHKHREISRSYVEMLNRAVHSTTIMCSYFLPGSAFRKRLERAAQRGVKIRVILTQMSDVPIVKHAERFLYRWMLENGIEIYEYKPAVVHAKVGVFDGRWATVGSYNINNLSAFVSVELNIDVLTEPFAQVLSNELEGIIRHDCLPITREERIREIRFLSGFVNWCCYQLIRVSMLLASFRIGI